MGNIPAHRLLDLVIVERINGVEVPARSFSDYKVTVKKGDCPAGVSIEEII
jgi:hypothetical protein